MSNAYLQRMPAGIPGDVTRKQNAVVEPAVYDPTNPPSAYGTPVVLDASTKQIRKVLATTLAADIQGFLVRPFPTSNINTTDGLGASTPNVNQTADILKSGYINVYLYGATAAAKGGKVYVRLNNEDSTHPLGGIEAALEWGSASAAKAGGNTGDGTFVLDATTPVAANATPGVYTLRCVEAVADGGKFVLLDPNGFQLGFWIIPAGAGNSITVNDQIKGVLTDGANNFIVGDGFDITVTANTLAIPNAFFTGPTDGDGVSPGNTEIAYNV